MDDLLWPNTPMPRIARSPITSPGVGLGICIHRHRDLHNAMRTHQPVPGQLTCLGSIRGARSNSAQLSVRCETRNKSWALLTKGFSPFTVAKAMNHTCSNLAIKHVKRIAPWLCLVRHAKQYSGKLSISRRIPYTLI